MHYYLENAEAFMTPQALASSLIVKYNFSTFLVGAALKDLETQESTLN